MHPLADQSRGPSARPAVPIVLAAALAGCGDGCQPERRDPGLADAPRDRLVVGMADEPTTLDPAYVSTTSARQILALVHRGLVRFDARGRVRPALAEAVPTPTVTSSGATVAWRLRARSWADGMPVTADDVRFAWQLERNEALEMRNARLAREVDAVRAVGPRAFVAEWSAPRPGLVAPGAHTVLPAHAYPRPTDAAPFEGWGREVLSNGPYRLKRWEAGVAATFVPNPHWTGPGPRIATLVVRFYGNEDALFLALLRGEVDAIGEAAGISGAKADLAAERLAGSHVVHRTDGGLWVHLMVDHGHPVTGDLAFRRALNARIDRSALRRVYGAAQPAFGMFPRNHPAHRAVEPPQPVAPEIQARVDALAATHPSLDLFIVSGSPRSADLATLVAETLEEMGFSPQIRAVPFEVLNQRLASRALGGLVLYGWRIRPDWDAYSILHAKGRQNYGGFADPAVDRHLEAAQRAVEPEAWARHLRRVARRFAERLPSLPLLHGQTVSIRPAGLTGWRPTGTTTPVTWNAEVWSWTPGTSIYGSEAVGSVRSNGR